MTEIEARNYSPLGLAYLGDAVFELLVRDRIVSEVNEPAAKYVNKAKHYVNAGAQSVFYDVLEPLLTETELAIMKRGRNAKGNFAARKNLLDYRRATGVEALFGYLHLLGLNDRMSELFEAVWSCRNIKIE